MSDAGQTGSTALAGTGEQELDAIRSAARWLVAASAAVLAGLVAGVQISAIGKTAEFPGWRIPVAIIATLVALAAVTMVLCLAARVLVSPGWSLRKLAHLELTQPERWRQHPVNAALAGSRTLLTPTEELELGKLYRAHGTLFAADITLREAGEATIAQNLLTEPASDATITYRADTSGDVDRLQRRLDSITEISTRIAHTANLAETQRRYRVLVWWLPVLGVLLALCVASFVLATAPAPGAPITTPTKMQIQFGADHQALRDAGLPTNCAGLTLESMAVGGTLQEPVVTSVSHPTCVLRQQRIPAGVAAILPAVPVKP